MPVSYKSETLGLHVILCFFYEEIWENIQFEIGSTGKNRQPISYCQSIEICLFSFGENSAFSSFSRKNRKKQRLKIYKINVFLK